MSVLKYFKNTPGDRGACRPPTSGDHWAQPTGAAGGPVAPPRATGVYPPI